MTTQEHGRGATSEFIVASILSQRGDDVFMPHTNTTADMIRVDTSGAHLIQIKTGTVSYTNGIGYEQVRLNKRSYKGTEDVYKEGDFDELWVVGTSVWCFPAEIVLGLPSLALSKETAGKSRKKKSYEPDDHIVIKGSWKNPVRNIFSY